MTVVTVSLSEEQARALHERAQRLRIPPEALLQALVDDWLSRPDEEFLRAMEHVLRKNEELYRRLAAGAG